ncbi:MAG TPA: SIMPL domain-containing protein [Methylophaga aminisulfidivorans]|uniref:SIMPL domain-containing protein n=2 Tax=root TaxID=1 RepID=A0A7C1VQ67_9GAMM|nr:SIMPL domain-containing protein [Methylophaga aminisulfidivorans]HEC73962.1 SIMPL domain-containing protein [Methylophaga aminisulfidivorans]
MNSNKTSSIILGISLILGLSCLGWLLANAALQYKAFERTVKVKGLSEKEYQADVVIWPIQFTLADNNLQSLYNDAEKNTRIIVQFLSENGIATKDITPSAPSITDKLAQQYGNNSGSPFRYTAVQTVTVYSQNIESVRNVMGKISELGKKGIVITGNGYASQTEYLFTRLNEVKPKMIEEATRKARAVAEKFAADSDSTLGKIRKASQGQFSISPRDNNNPQIKKVRVVSTIEYYLSD